MGSISIIIHTFYVISDPSPDRSFFRLLDFGLVTVPPFDRRHHFFSKGRGNSGAGYLLIDVEVCQKIRDFSILA